MVWQNKPKKAKIGLRENLSPHDIQLLVKSPLLIRFLTVLGQFFSWFSPFELLEIGSSAERRLV